MKILYIVHQFYPEYSSGTEKIVLNIATMTQKMGNKVKVICHSSYEDSFYDKKDDSNFYREFLYEDIPVISYKNLEPQLDFHYSLENNSITDLARKILQEEKPDIVHFAHFMRVSEFVKATKELNIPYIITLTDSFLLCPKVILTTSNGSLCGGPNKGENCRQLCPELPSSLINNRLNISREILYGAQKVISPSIFLTSIFKSEFPDLEIEIINHGISKRKIKKNEKHYEEKEKLIIGFAGSIEKHKGLDVLVEAFSKIVNTDLSLEIYGSGSDKDYVNKLTNLAKQDKRIKFCGMYSEKQIGNIFNNIDILVIPSICYESYSLVLHEALASNLPVIATNIGALSEKIKNGINGFTFNIGDSEDLKEKLNIIINEPELINLMKEKIRKDLIPTIEQEAYLYERRYKQIVT